MYTQKHSTESMSFYVQGEGVSTPDQFLYSRNALSANYKCSHSHQNQNAWISRAPATQYSNNFTTITVLRSGWCAV